MFLQVKEIKIDWVKEIKIDWVIEKSLIFLSLPIKTYFRRIKKDKIFFNT